MPLTNIQCAAAKAREKPYKISDSGGMYLLVNRAGKYWRMDYRLRGLRKTLAIGVYPRVSLRDARKTRDAAKDLLARGVDPSASKQALVKSRGALFGDIAGEYLQKRISDGISPSTEAGLRNRIHGVLGRGLLQTPVDKITAPDLLAELRRIEQSGRVYTAAKARGLCSEIFRYAIATGRATHDPAADLRGALIRPSGTHRAAIRDPEALGILLRKIDTWEGAAGVRTALRMLPLVFVRPVELREAEWSEVDLAKREWRVPADRMKARREHIVPLADQVVGLLQGLLDEYGCGRFVFPGVRDQRKPINGTVLNCALRSLGYGPDEMTCHGFRGTASTLLHEQGWESVWIERQLAHVDKNTVRSAYNAAQHLPERRKMMQEWANYLDSLRKV